MRFIVLTLLALSAPLVVADSARVHALAPIPGFELRLLDRKLPLEIVTGTKVETRELPIWIYMPKPDGTILEGDAITESNDLSGGTAHLPPPPAGFGLRALKLPVRETLALDDGRITAVEVPVFIYFRKIPAPGTVLTERSISESSHAHEDKRALEEADRELARLYSRIAQLKQEFAVFISILPDGTAREQLKVLIAKMTSVGPSGISQGAYNQDSMFDTNIK